MARTREQYKWRNNGNTVASVCAHLGPHECAILDAIAIELYERDPHDPRHGKVGELFPGRAEGIRFLCRRYTEEGAHRGARWLKKLATLRVELSEFWVREASWRRTTAKSLENAKGSGPVPGPPHAPWPRSPGGIRATGQDIGARKGTSAWEKFRETLHELGDEQLEPARDLLEGEIQRRSAIVSPKRGAPPGSAVGNR